MPSSSNLLSRMARGAPLVGVPFAFGAIHHGLAVASPSAGDASSPTRHLVFVGINLFFGAAFALRVRWTILPAALLAGQQILSHGGAFLEARRAGIFDTESAAVLCFLPLVLVTALALWRAGAGTSAGGASPSSTSTSTPPSRPA